ncbi:limonene-1,2-epoxide hydrolase family protein [Kutzneria viridogrisea]|uniref:Limonene-1,2-epoxide hydrolase domain-containing protein n=2 Tax=Kutzneria TaxID=43356 RepID=W5WHP8_9PSEU|nr:limonene-1,2-epoxide hydrolase family protein [Kutzneria albida]AHI00276.1 hypothetical protein KALB_6917 [Kutzneria albida DSM 43870]MBA8925452.1 limonene-1,2-epoxide hydrolase [Kutzneria viridogrisea]
MTDSAEDTVTAFLAALEDLDVDRALSYAAPGIVYQNVPLPAARGIRAVGGQLRAMAKVGSGFEVRMHSIATKGTTVLTERTDVLKVGPVAAEFWVCGTFEVHEGRITLWRDYFDWPTFLFSWLRGAVRAVLRTPARRSS